MRRWYLASIVLWTAACGGRDDCDLPALERPAEDAALQWVGGPNTVIEAFVNGAPARLLLDTGYPHSAVTAERAVSEGVTLQFGGGTQTGPWPSRLLGADFARAAGVDAVVGADVLHQLPWRMDARARTTTLLAQASEGAIGLERIQPDDCALHSPVALRIDATVDGLPVRLLLDTGAELTLVRTQLQEAITQDGRATLTGLRLHTGFTGGAITATATRARTLRIGEAEAQDSLLLSAPEADAYLDRLQADYGGEVHGLLGWSFLREFSLTHSEGALTLERHDTQSHWTREFLGIGILRSASAAPPGIRVDGFLGTSPARDAGLEAGDVITRVNDVPITGSEPLPGAPGTRLTLTLHRDGEPGPLQFEVTYADLLPDPD